MRFRWKLLILLLLISIGPIALMRTIGLSSVRQFRDTLIDRVRQNRITSEHDRMLLIADAHALVLWEARSQVEAALMALAAHAEQLLGNQPTAGSRVLFAADFDAGVDLPGDTMVSTPHFRQGEKGRMAYLPVSYTEPVFHVSSSVDPASVAGDIARLSGMRDTFRRLARLLEDSAIWQNIGLANGLFCEFPGHGSIPAAFDTRHQLWYERAMEGRRPAWTMPFVDPATRQVVLAAVVPLLQSAEEIAGAASIVVPVSRMLRNQLFSRNIPATTRVFMCQLLTRAEVLSKAPDHGAKVLIIAQDKQAEALHRSWRAELAHEWLRSSDSPQFEAFLTDVAAGTSDVRRMRFEDRDLSLIHI